MAFGGVQPASAPQTSVRTRRRADSGRIMLLRVLADIVRPAAGPVETDGPARLRLNPADAGLIRRLLKQTRDGRLELTGAGGLLEQLAWRVLEVAVTAGPIDDLGARRHRRSGAYVSCRNGRRSGVSQDSVYPMIFVDAIHVKARAGAMGNRSIYAAVAVTAEGRREIVALWAGDGRCGTFQSAPAPEADSGGSGH